MTSKQLRLFLRLSRPLYLLGSVLLYFLGAGIARFLGLSLDSAVLIQGLLWVLLLQLSIHYLVDYFDERVGIEVARLNPFRGDTQTLGPGKLPRAVALWAALISLTFNASLTVLLIRSGSLAPATTLILILLLTGALTYVLPPVRLAGTGYAELLISIMITNLVPAFAYLLQAGEFHRLLGMATFPLTALHLVMILAYEFADYATDFKYEMPTLLVSMGWRSGITLHNLMILAAFLIIGIAAAFGLPIVIAVPAFIPFPLGMLAVWQMSRIGAGAPPNWRAFTLTAVALFLSTGYLMTFAFWIR